ncbi:MAG: AbrB/MazE/SpoVT family DNA-binding domain-containing protein [Clostridia bacterium]|nr:AbrB/MazE/SpoVT family DNA-binding domain-containing protein [Clostridia bacterium]MBQ5770993.1 AbrB/MazE/SpoVT family DNA-binding domain-containing protein [Clostridia bacterium]
MRATGIVRRIDDLGRIVVPKEIRRTLRIREGDPLEIYTDHDGEVVLKKYSPIGEIAAIAKDYTDSLYRTLGHIVLISDRDAIVAVSGASKKDSFDKALSTEADQILKDRTVILKNISDGDRLIPLVPEDDVSQYTSQIICPIVSDAEVVGGLMLLSKESGVKMSGTDLKVAETACVIIGRQMEQ